MSNTIADLSQRQEALKPEQSFIVQAPAGSGKTGLLIQRYLRLLSLVDNPEEIIAITFTRKAAAEMQGRVLAALNQAGRGETGDSEYERQSIDLAKSALAQNQKRGWQLLENPCRLQVQTIDSFCASLVRQMPLLSRIGGMQTVMDDAVPVYEQAADATLLELESRQAWSGAITRLLDHLDNNLPRLKSLLVDMLQKRDQWLRYVLDGYERQHLLKALDNLLVEKLTHVKTLFPEELEAELCAVLKFAAGNLAAIKPDSDMVVCAEIQSLPGIGATDLKLWSGIADFLMTSGGTWRINLNKNNGFPPATSKSVDSELYAEMKGRMKSLLNQLARVEGLELAVADIRTLPSAGITDYEWEVVDALCQLLTLAATQLQILFNERNQQDFIGISQSAVTALGSADAPTDLAMYLDYQIKHILVDEFQDISVNQHELMMRLTSGWSGDDGRTLFLVGDPMQSIYRFREAEVGNFIHTFHHRQLESVPLTPLVLSSNFRSDASIVNWINAGFTEVLAEQDDLTTGAVSFHPSTATRSGDDSPKVNVYPLFDDAGEAEAEKIPQLIQSLQDKQDAGDIAILVRTRNHLLDIIPRLREAGIRCQAIDIEALGKKPAIQDVLALTRAWLHPADRIAWLSILRAPWCGIDLKHLYLIAGSDKDALIRERINDESVLASCDEFSRRRIQLLADIFNDMNCRRHRLSVRKTIETIWMRLGGPATLESEADIDNVKLLFELLDSLDRGNDIDDLQLLINEVSQLFGKTESDDKKAAIQVMTMHKAKGLEFDHVILPGLGRTTRYSSTELMKWMLRPREDGGHDLFIGAIKQTGEEKAPIYQYIQNVEKMKDNYESQRLLYVAATRARKSLHLLGSVRRKQDRNGKWECSASARSLLGHLWPVVKDDYISTMENPQTVKAMDLPGIDNRTRRLKDGWQLPELPPMTETAKPIEVIDTDASLESIEYEWAGETIKRVGIVVHRCIQWMAKEGITSLDEKRIAAMKDKFKSMLLQTGLGDDDLRWGVKQVTTALKNMMQDERGRWVLANDHQQQDNELSITGMYDSHIITAIIDRTFVDQYGKRWIIDYKSSRHEGTDLDAFLDQEQERYSEQLNKYATLMAALDERPIYLGLYFPLLKGWREWGFKSEG